MRTVLRSKIHLANVTDCNIDYIGSILVDRELMEKIDLWEHEKVLVCDITNGNRFETYVIPGERGAGDISVQGATAKLCNKGDRLIIMSFDVTDRPIEPVVILVDENNRFVEYLQGGEMKTIFTEQDTERYYDAEDVVYRSLWDKDGVVHWGIFDESTGTDFPKACANLNHIMAEKAGIDGDSRVLDLGCGSGTNSLWLCQNLGASAVGVDLSGVRIGNAREALGRQTPEVQNKVDFRKASATDLPFDNGSFTHVWSQAVLYHVHDKDSALKEAYRVLEEGGIFVFDDLTKPRAEVSDMAQKYVYDRLLFDTDFSFESYQDALKSAGFQVLEAQDITPHLMMSYQHLAGLAKHKANGYADRHTEKYRSLSLAYEKTVETAENGELGWAMYLCQKV